MLKLTPLDIHNQAFKKSFRGYNEDEVNEFLDIVIKDYEQMIRTNKMLEEKMITLSERIEHYKSIEDSLSKSIIVAQETAEEVRNQAKQESLFLIREAETTANRIIEDAIIKSKQIEMQMEELKKEKVLYFNRFKNMIDSQLEILDSFKTPENPPMQVKETIRLEEYIEEFVEEK